MSAMFWQIGLLILLIAFIDLLIRKWAWPQLRYALWSLILIKLILSPALSLPSGLAPKLKPVLTRMLESAADKELIEVTWPIVIPSTNDEFRQTVMRSYPSHPTFAESNLNAERRYGEVSAQDNIEQVQTDDPMPDTGILIAQSPNYAIFQPVGPRLDWRVYMVGIWLLGLVILGTYLFVKLHRLKKEQTDGLKQYSLPESFYNQLNRCAQQLKLRQKPRVVTTTRIKSPAVFGFFQPVLLMPIGYIRKLSRKDTEYMLLHELAHIKRGDLTAHSFCMILRLVYWYNPLLWLVGRKLRHLRELCCDATVASLLKDKTVEYRQTLLETARRFLAMPVEPGLGLVGLFEDSNRLIARINWLKKPIWRYRKMKNAAVITIVLILLACVLPMAQAQNPQAEDANVSSEQTEETSSQSTETLETEQDESQTKEQLLQAKQALEFQLQQLQIEQQKLQKQLQALMQARQAQEGDAARASLEAKMTKDMAIQDSMKAKEAKDKAAKIKAHAEAQKANIEAHKADAEAKKAEAEAKKWEQWAQKMEAQAEPYNAWAKEWTNSEAFKQWQKEMEQWAKEQAKAHSMANEGSAFPTPVPHPRPHPMPAMPPMPPMPVKVDTVNEGEVAVDVEVVDTPKVVVPAPPIPPMSVPAPPNPPTVVVPTPPIPPVPPRVSVPVPVPPAPLVVSAVPPILSTPVDTPPPVAPPAPVLPTPAQPIQKTDRDITVSKNKDGRFVATTQMHFVSKVKPGIPFIVRNNLGNIILRPSKDDTCDVRAVIRAEAKSADKAKELVEQVGMTIDSSEDRYYLKPVKTDGNQWSNLNVDFTITVPAGVKPDIKTDLGNIELYDLKGHVKALTDLGSVKAVNTTGNMNLASDLGGIKFTAPKDLAAGQIELFTKMGDIEFIAPRDLSTKLQAETKMGSIKSDLPLKVTEIDMFKRKAEGTLGEGGSSVRMQTDMGTILLKWLPSPEETELPVL